MSAKIKNKNSIQCEKENGDWNHGQEQMAGKAQYIEPLTILQNTCSKFGSIEHDAVKCPN